MLTVFVSGTGAAGNAVVDASDAYHCRFTPVAVNAVAVWLRQYSTGVATIGGVGKATTVTVIISLVLSQPFTVWLT